LRAVLSCKSPGGAGGSYFVPTHLRIDALFFGVLLCYYRQFQPQIFQWIARSNAGYFTILAGVCVVLMTPYTSLFQRTVGFTVTLLASGCLLARVIDLRPNALVRQLARVGAYSYSIYLWHMPLSNILPHTGLISFLVYVGLSVAVGIGMARLIEIPGLMLRDRWFPSISAVPQESLSPSLCSYRASRFAIPSSA